MRHPQPSVNAPGLDPRAVLRQARRARSRAEKFDAFSDTYMWILLVGFGLAYAFGFLRAWLGALLGEFAAPVPLPSAVLPLGPVLLVAVLVIPALMARLLLHLGPAAVSAAQAVWWLSLPIDLRGLHAAALRRARWIGALGSVAAGVLWFALCCAVLPAPTLVLAAAALGAAVLAGVLVANLAVIAQARGATNRLRRAGTMLLWAVVLASLAGWGLAVAGILPDVEGRMRDWAWQGRSFLVLALVLLVLVLLTHGPAGRAVRGIPPRVLRAAGQRQQVVSAALGVMNPGAAFEQAPAIRGPRARRQKRGARLPVLQQALLTRVWRRRLAVPPLGMGLALAAVLLLVRSAANPMTLAVGLLPLLVLLMLAAASAVEPLLASAALRRMLAADPTQVVRAAAWLILPAALLATCLAVGVAAWLFVLPSWTAALAGVLLASGGVFAGAVQRAGRGHQDFSGQLLAAGTSTEGFAAVGYSLSGVLPVLAGAAPLLAVLLGTTDLPWVLWAVGALACGGALAALREKAA